MRAAFHRRVRAAIADPKLQSALDRNAERRLRARLAALATLPDAPGVRRQAAATRHATVEHLDQHVAALQRRLAENGWQVHEAATAEAACAQAVAICRAHGATLVAKSKSMVTEEIGLNPALERAGLRVVETDLGEYVVQLRGEPPAHIISPIVHLTRQDVGELFHQRLGIPYTDEVAVLNAAARRALRPAFLEAQVGISGANLAVAETGSIVLVTNEGNGRLVTAAPPVHIAFIGIERVVPTLADLPPLLQLLPRSATGQILTSYVSLIQGPRAPGDADGPVERHAILLDNGRRAMAASGLRESLACIRCGACLNVCPVFREIGGHAYASAYPGPIGSVVSPGLFGLASHGHLAKASSLCGACREVCPADIDLPSMLLRLRDEYVRHVPQPWWWQWGLRAFAQVAGGPRRFGTALRILGWVTPLLPSRTEWTSWLPGPLGAWSRWRHFPRFQRRPFRDRLRELNLAARAVEPTPMVERTTLPLPRAPEDVDLIERFQRELEAVGGEVVRIPASQMPAALGGVLESTGCSQVLLAWPEGKHLQDRASLEAALRELTAARILHAGQAREACTTLEQAEGSVGLTPAVAALADSGTIVIESGAHGALDASLLPATHIAVLEANDIFPTFADWAGRGGRSLLLERSSVALVTGPSRTADIEMILTIGVHGPRRLIVLVCEAPGSDPTQAGQ